MAEKEPMCGDCSTLLETPSVRSLQSRPRARWRDLICWSHDMPAGAGGCDWGKGHLFSLFPLLPRNGKLTKDAWMCLFISAN